MKKRIISILLIFVLLFTVMPISFVNAADTKVTITVTADKTEAKRGDTITYTVSAQATEQIQGICFELNIPTGLTYVVDSGALAPDLTEKLGTLDETDFYEAPNGEKIITIGHSLPFTLNGTVTLTTFKCTVDDTANGDYNIGLSEVLITDAAIESIDSSYVSVTPTTTKVVVPATGITLNKNSISLTAGSNETLTATKAPTDATGDIAWTSDNEAVATVNNGKVTAVSVGTAVITATINGHTATCNVTVVCGHTTISPVSAKTATCTEEGNNAYYKCDACGQAFKDQNGTQTTTEQAETISELGHDFSVEQSNDTQHWNKCSRCDVTDTKVNHSAESDEWQSDENNHWKECGCGVQIEKEAHTTITTEEENVDPTCTANGSYTEVVKCSVCNKVISRTENKPKPATGHKAGTPKEENKKPATCTTEGSYDEVIYCTVCNNEISRNTKTISATGHTAGEPKQENITPATHTATGSYDEVIYCTVCNHEMSRTAKTTPVIPHDDLSNASWESDTTDHWKECGCGVKLEIANHIPEANVAKEHIVPAECEKAGSHDEVIYCSVCHYEISRTQGVVDNPTGHTEGTPVKENVVPAECEKAGSHDEVVYCTVCGEELSRTENVVDNPTGHTEGTPVKENIVPAECEKEGSYDEVTYCTKCHKKLNSETKTTEKTGHKPATPVKENEVEATASKEGKYDEVTYCSVCNKELNREEKTTPKFVYEMLEGMNSKFYKENKEGLTFKANGKVENFIGVKVDGKDVNKDNYTVESGSTIVTLKTDYLNTLSVGEHKLTIAYKDGEVETNFKIDEKLIGTITPSNEDKDSPKTGDNTNMTLWISGLVVSGILFVIVLGWVTKGRKVKTRRH